MECLFCIKHYSKSFASVSSLNLYNDPVMISFNQYPHLPNEQGLNNLIKISQTVYGGSEYRTWVTGTKTEVASLYLASASCFLVVSIDCQE